MNSKSSLIFLSTLALILSVFLASASSINLQDLVKRKRNSGNTGKFRNSGSEEGRDTVITFFNDRKGVTGIDMYKYADAKIQFQGQRVYPVAVHQDEASAFLYDIFELDGSGLNPIYVQVVDMCDKSDSSCNNVNRFNYGRLFDVHKSAWDAIGKNDGIIRGNYKRIGHMGPNELPDRVWSSSYILCSCSGGCNESNREWRPVGKCSN